MSSTSSSTPTSPQTPLNSPVLSQSSDFSPILSPLSPRVGQSTATLSPANSPARKVIDPSTIQSKHSYNPNTPPFEYKLDKQVPQIHSKGVRGSSSHPSEDVFDREIWNNNFVQHLSSYPPPTTPINSIVDNRVPAAENFADARVSQNTEKSSSASTKPSFGYSQLPSIFSPWNVESSPNTNPPLFNLDQQTQNTTSFSRYFPNPPSLRTNVSPIWGLFAPAELKTDLEGSNSNFSPLISPNDPISSNSATTGSNTYSRKSVSSTSPTFINTPFVTNLLRPRGDREANWDTSSLISTIATASQSIALTTESDIEEENNIGGISSVEFDYSQLDEDDQELIEASSSILDTQSDDRRKALGLDNTSTKTKGGFVSIFERTQQLANRYMSLGFPKDLVLCAIEACGDNPTSVAAWLYSYQSQFLQQPLNRSSPITSPSPSPILTPISTLRSSGGGLFASEGSAFAAPIERNGKRSFSRNPFSEATETNERQQEDPEKRNIFFGFRPYYASSPNGLDDLSFEGTVDDGFRTGYFDLDLDGEKMGEEAGPPSVPICRFYVQGYCKNASKCAFYHPPKHPLVSPTPPSPTTNATSTSPTDVSNVICRFHTAGNCKKGKNCPYLHPEGFRPAHNSSPPPRSSPSPHSHTHTTYSYPVPRSPKISDFFPPTLSEKEKKHARHGSDSHSRKGSPIPDNLNEEKEREGISSRRSPIFSNDQKEDQSVNDIGSRKGRTSVGLKSGSESVDSEIGNSDGLKQKASKAYRLGVHLYHEGQFEKALQFLRNSYENFPSKEAQSMINKVLVQQAEEDTKKRELERERKKREDEEKLRAEKERKKTAEREEKERRKREEEERKIKEEIERREKEREERERERKERERKEREREEKERERKEKEREERERKEKEKKEKERKKKEKAELERREKLEKERLEKERQEVEKRERLERQKLETELREKEAREKLERERIQRSEHERKEREDREREEGERKERESANRLAAEKLEREKIEREEKNLVQRVHSNEGADRPRTFSIEYTAGVPGMPGSDNLYNTESEEGRNDSDLENEGMPDLMSEEERSPSPPTREDMPPLISDRDDDEQSTESDHSNSNSGEEDEDEDEEDEEDEEGEGEDEEEEEEEEEEYDGGSKNQGWISWLFGWTEDFSNTNDPECASLENHIHNNPPQAQQPTKPSSTTQTSPDQIQTIKKIRNATNHYQVLDLQQSSDQFPNPSFDDIEKQYHKIAEKLHPKKNPAPDAKDAYYTLTLAYTILSDPASRKGYDDLLAKKTGVKSVQTKFQPQSYPRSLSNPTLSNTDTPPFVRTKISRRRIVPSWKAHSSSSQMKGKWLLTRWTLYVVRFSLSLFVLALWCIFISLKWVFGGVAALYFTFKYRKHMKWCRSCGEYHAVGGQGSFYEEDGRYYFIKEGVRHDVSDLVNNRAFLSHTLSHHPHYASYLSHSHSHSHPHWYEEDYSEGESENSSDEEIELLSTNPTNKNTKKKTSNAIANPAPTTTTTTTQLQHGKKKSKGKKKR